MKYFWEILGGVLVLTGLVIFWLPVPLGLVLIGTGLAILITTSKFVRRWVRHEREEHDAVDEVLKDAEDNLPDELARPLKQTNKDND